MCNNVTDVTGFQTSPPPMGKMIITGQRGIILIVIPFAEPSRRCRSVMEADSRLTRIPKCSRSYFLSVSAAKKSRLRFIRPNLNSPIKTPILDYKASSFPFPPYSRKMETRPGSRLRRISILLNYGPTTSPLRGFASSSYGFYRYATPTGLFARHARVLRSGLKRRRRDVFVVKPTKVPSPVGAAYSANRTKMAPGGTTSCHH